MGVALAGLLAVAVAGTVKYILESESEARKRERARASSVPAVVGEAVEEGRESRLRRSGPIPTWKQWEGRRMKLRMCSWRCQSEPLSTISRNTCKGSAGTV
jgi:hypothetical protein